MNRSSWNAWAIALACVVLAPHAAAEQADARAGAEFGSRLNQLAAELLSQRVDSLDLKYIEPDAAGQNDGWGVAYRWNAERVQDRVDPGSGRFLISSLSYDFAIDGAYAFSDAANNQDLSTARLAVRLARGDLGEVRPVAAASGDAYEDCLGALPPDSDDETEQARIDLQELQCAIDHGVAEIVEDESDSYYYWLDFHGGVEGDQDYSESRTLFGVSAAYAYQPEASNARFNVPDWPFRVLRKTFGDAGGYIAPLPSAMLTLERLDAGDDEERSALVAGATYTRASAEIAFQTIIANLGGRPLRFNVSYRYFRELSPPAAIKAAGLDSFDFVRASIRFPAHLAPFVDSDDYELFVGYTSGRLPFDLVSDEAFEIGIATNIKVLGELLSR